MTNEDIIEKLEEGISAAVTLLVERVKKGSATASDISQLRALFKEAGGALTFGSRTTPAGDSVLESLADVDQSLFN